MGIILPLGAPECEASNVVSGWRNEVDLEVAQRSSRIIDKKEEEEKNKVAPTETLDTNLATAVHKPPNCRSSGILSRGNGSFGLPITLSNTPHPARSLPYLARPVPDDPDHRAFWFIWGTGPIWSSGGGELDP